MQFVLEQFTPAEAAEASGMTQMTLRNMRRKGIWEAPEGHARYDIGGIGQMRIVEQLYARGISRRHAADISEQVVDEAFVHFVGHPNSYSEAAYDAAWADVEAAFLEGCYGFEVEGLEEIEPLRDETPEVRIKRLMINHRLVSEAKATFGIVDRTLLEWCAVWPDGEIGLYANADLSKAFVHENIRKSHRGPEGPVLLIDLWQFGRATIESLPRPPIKLADESS